MTDVAPGPTAPVAEDQRGRALARSSLINLVGFAAYGVSNFLLIVVVTQRLGASGAGALLEAIAVFNIVARSAMAGTDLALVRFTSRFLTRNRHRELRTLFRIALRPVLAVSVTAGAALFLLADPLGHLLTSGESAESLTTYLRVLAPFIPIACVYQVIEGGSRGFGTMLPGVVVERFGRSSLLPIVMLLVLAGGGSATVVGLAWAGPFALALIPMALWTTSLLRRAERDLVARLGGTPAAPEADVDLTDRELAAVAGTDSGVEVDLDGDAALAPGTAPAPLPEGELRKRFWSFAIPRSFAGVFALTIMWVDALLLGAMEGTEAVGVYTAATRWLIVGNFAGNAVTIAFGPQISAVLASDRDGAAGRLFRSAAAWFILLAWPPYLTAMVFAPFLVTAFGSDFGDGAAVIVITGIGFLFSSAAGPIDMLLLMAGRSRLSLINTGVALVTNVGANLLLIPVWGIRGAALAWTCSLVVANGLPLVQMYRLLGIQPFGARTLRALGIGALVGVGLLAGRAALGPTAGGLALGLALGGAALVAGVRFSPDRMGVEDMLRRTAR